MIEDTEECLTWLTEALRRLRLEGQTKVVNYLEEVREEVLFEEKGHKAFLAEA